MYRDNSAKSSANFYKAFAAGIWHNTRFGNKPLSSFAEYEHRNIANLSFEAAKEIEAKLLEERSQKYMETHNQKFQCKTAFIELVVNMREHHTLADLGLIAELVEKTFGYTPTLLAIHADEGHYDPETGDFLANVHGHIRFCVLDPLDGTSLYRKEMRTTPDRPLEERKKKISQFQTDIAQILNMERGISKEITGRKHLTPYEFKKMMTRPDVAEKMVLENPEIIKKAIKKMTLKKLKEMSQEVTEELKKLGALRGDYAEFEALKKTIEQKLKAKEPLTFENVDRHFSAFLETFKNEIKRATEGAIINSINTLKCDKKQDGGHTIVGKYSQARNNGTYDVIKIVANQMSIAMNYGQNLRVAELEKIKKERDDVIKERDEAKKELNKAIEDRDKAFNSLKIAQKAIRHWKEVAESFQDEAIEKMSNKRGLVKKDPTAEEVVIKYPFATKHPSVDQLDR